VVDGDDIHEVALICLRTSEPFGAMKSYSAGRCIVANASMSKPVAVRSDSAGFKSIN